jgi:sulfur-oxidizing protein SoxB
VYFREPSTNIGVASMNRPPHIVGEALLKLFKLKPGSRGAYAFSHLDFAAAARRYGKLGGFAHLATLVKKLRAERKATLLLDGGDTWQGSATSLWTRGQDMIEAQKLLGVDIMTGHWEFTYGAERVKEVVAKDFAGRIEFLAQNVETGDFGDPVFKPYTIRSLGDVPVAIIGQAFPYTPIAHPRRFLADWRFGIEEKRLQGVVQEARGKGAAIVVLLSHNGMDVDLKLASRVTGIDVILGGHTHDAVPIPIPVRNRAGRTLVTNAGSNGKFLAVLDLEVKGGKIGGYRYRLLPVFANLLAADPEMAKLIEDQRSPFAAKLSEELARTDAVLYRRGNFNGSFDQLILDALMEAKGAEIALSPGFRWGTSLLPGDAITLEQVMNQTRSPIRHRVSRSPARRSSRSRRTSATTCSTRSLLPAGRNMGGRRRRSTAARPATASAHASATCACAASRSRRTRSTRSRAGPRWPTAYRASRFGRCCPATCATRRSSCPSGWSCRGSSGPRAISARPDSP